MPQIPYIEAVTVCVGYADLLAETAKYNVPHFDRWIIVTTPDDLETRELCRKLNLHCIQTEDGRRHGPEGFNKGRMIERGLQQLSKEGWRMHIDADIALPHRFCHLLEVADIEENKIYGFDRIMVRNYDDWMRLKQSNWLTGGQYDYKCRVNFPTGYDVGTRWAHPEMGFCPIGFAQLWYSEQDEWRGIRVKPYPSKHGNACRTDVQHALQFDRRRRELLPEVIVAHLESERGKLGVNWNGRKTKRFGPEDKKLVEKSY